MGFEIINNTLLKYIGEESRVTIPYGVRKIGKEAFYGCTHLQQVTIPDSVEEVERGAFDRCPQLRWFWASEQWKNRFWYVHKSLNYEGPDFYVENQTAMRCIKDFPHVCIPEGVTRILARAFENCTLVYEVEVPDSLQDVHPFAFPERIKIIASEEWIREHWYLKREWRAFGPEFEVEDGILLSCISNEKYIKLPENVRHVSGGAFAGCRFMESLEIPDWVESVNKDGIPKEVQLIVSEKWRNAHWDFMAEWRCYGPELEIRNGVLRSVWTEAAELVLPEGIIEIASNAMQHVPNLKKIVIPDKLEVRFPKGALKHKIAFEACDRWKLNNWSVANNARWAKIVEIPEGVTEIAKDDFSECCEVEKIIIPATVRHISASAFRDCSNLREIVFLGEAISLEQSCAPKVDEIKITIAGVSKSYGELCFQAEHKTLSRDTGLGQGATIPEGVTVIGKYAFRYNNKLKDVVLPQSLRGIRTGAFADCKNLERIVFPERLQEIGALAFDNCSKLKEIEFKGRYISLLNSGIPNLKKVKIIVRGQECPDLWAFDLAGGTLRRYVGDAEIVTIPKEVIRIRDEAFVNCPNLKKVVIPDSVCRIGVNAFAGCDQLEELCVWNSDLSLEGTGIEKCPKATIFASPEWYKRHGKGLRWHCIM